MASHALAEIRSAWSELQLGTTAFPAAENLTGRESRKRPEARAAGQHHAARRELGGWAHPGTGMHHDTHGSRVAFEHLLRDRERC